MLNNTIINTFSSDNNIEELFFKMIDTGIDDMENGRELPLEEAFRKISELRTSR